MKPLGMVALATLLALGGRMSSSAHQPKLHHRLSPSLLPHSQKATPQKNFVDATIRHIDHGKGLLTLETDCAVMQVKVSPEKVLDLHVGDELQVQVLDPDCKVV
jgi:hypothetical protein